jgi:recombination protein RecT
MANNLQKPRFSVAITTPVYQNMIRNTLGDPELAKRFIAAITSAVAVNSALQECEASTILSGALLGNSLGLSPSPQLGQYYLVPFKQKAKYDRQGRMISPEISNAQFIMGYKGFIQLAVRSGQYRNLNACAVKAGELISYNPFADKVELSPILDFAKREDAPTIGYYCMFEYLNGFRKEIFWSKEQMEKHADTFSSAFSLSAYQKLQRGEIPEKDLWKYSSFWYKDFDSMAEKTMLRQLISRWGIMSIEMQNAIDGDQSVVHQNEKDGTFSFVHESSDLVGSSTPFDALPMGDGTPEDEQNTDGGAAADGEPVNLNDLTE